MVLEFTMPLYHSIEHLKSLIPVLPRGDRRYSTIERSQSASRKRNSTCPLSVCAGSAASAGATENAVHHHAARGCAGQNAPAASMLTAVNIAIAARLP